jgi:multiple sugar transport system ATP-binding protein
VLNAGAVEQVGSPLELYHHPLNLFVAGFIGSPKMNFFATEVQVAGPGGVTVSLPGGRPLTVPVVAGNVAKGSKATLGIRPEHLRLSEGGELAGDIVVAERLGGETFFYLRLPDQPMVVVQAEGGDSRRLHDRVGVSLDPANCHLFDAEGRALPHLQRNPLAPPLVGRAGRRQSN